VITLVGGICIFIGVVFLVVNIVRGIRRGAIAGNNPWQSRTLEWMVSSPPPEENFERQPQVLDYPFGYGVEGSRHAILEPETVEAGGDHD
jgi:cytochrome c oxidase subunit 1